MAEVHSKISDRLLEQVEDTIHRSQQYFLSSQYPDGYWWGELESNPTMEAEYLLLTYFLDVVDRERWRKLVNYIISKQREGRLLGPVLWGPGGRKHFGGVLLRLEAGRSFRRFHGDG